MAQLASLSVNDTGSLTLPSGTSANRPSLSSTVIVQWTNTGTQAVSVTSGSATTTTTSWTCPTGVTSIEVLVVAGGGGGGGGGLDGGGGGAGGLIYNSAFPVTPATSYTVTVGAGGAASTASNTVGTNGSNSIFGSLTAIGGGGGANGSVAGNAGGSGGGGGGDGSTTVKLGGAGTAGQGFAGGISSDDGGGGGGAGGPGYVGTGDPTNQVTAGEGGPGLNFNISGTPTWYAGGGGGSGETGGVGGSNIGGFGGNSPSGSVDVGGAGTASTGSGGGGSNNTTAGAGGSGIVIIRYTLATSTTQPTGQARFNTGTGTFEHYETSNRWKTPAIGANIVTNGLVALYDAARYASGTIWTDLTGNGNDLTLSGSPTYSSSNGGYITFDGSTQKATKTSFVGFGSNPEYTFSAWVKLANASQGAGSDYPIIWLGNGNAVGAVATLDTKGMNFCSMHWADDQTFTQLTLTTYAWYYATITYSPNTKIASLYVNGNFISQVTHSSALNIATQTLTLGGGTWAGYYFNGSIATAQIYSRILTTQEIQQNYNAQSSRFELTSPVESRQSYVTDRLVVNLDLKDPACCPPNQSGNILATLTDIAGGTIGTCTNGATPIVTVGGSMTTVTATQKFGHVVLDGTNDCIAMSNPNIYLGNQHSYDMWIYVTGIKDATYARAYIFDLRGDGADSGCSSYFLWDYVSAGTVNFITGNGGTEVTASGIALSTNTWHHMATTRDGSQWRIYLDGVLLTQGASNLTGLTLNNAYRIGMYSAWGFSTAQYALPGYVGAARIYTKTLTSGEVQTNYQAMKNRYGL